ncbi:hypothetical protein SEVIR_4G160201v4 [Setaria viridis]
MSPRQRPRLRRRPRMRSCSSEPDAMRRPRRRSSASTPHSSPTSTSRSSSSYALCFFFFFSPSLLSLCYLSGSDADSLPRCHQEETLDDLVDSGIDDLVVSFYQMDANRTLFFLLSYFRLRLQKLRCDHREAYISNSRCCRSYRMAMTRLPDSPYRALRMT